MKNGTERAKVNDWRVNIANKAGVAWKHRIRS